MNGSIVEWTIHWINSFPSENTVFDSMSPGTILQGSTNIDMSTEGVHLALMLCYM